MKQTKMKKIRVFFDKEGNTLDVWCEKPKKVISEEVGHKERIA